LEHLTPKFKNTSIVNMNEWTEINSKLMRTYYFSCFTEAMAWMMKASFTLKIQDHYPVWTNINNMVYVTLSSVTDEGLSISSKDRQMARILDRLYLFP
jgi:4a-hydroxytetrahydrobiopterin dehydratase